MRIRNAVIITDENSELSMTADEQEDFQGNFIGVRSNLPDALVRELDDWLQTFGVYMPKRSRK